MDVDKIGTGRNIQTILKILPDLLEMEQTWGILATQAKQWGTKDAMYILLEVVRKTGVVNSIRYLFDLKLNKLLSNLLLSMWDTFGDKEAIIVPEQNKRFTFREFKERTLRVSNGLHDLGLKAGNRVAIMLYNGDEFIESALGSWFIGCITPFVNWHFRGEELVTMLNRVEPSTLILDEEFIERIDEVKDRLRGIEHCIVVGKKVPDGMLSYEDLVKRSSNKSPPTEFVLGASLYTGGTTGVPKSVATFDSFGYLLSNKSRTPHGASFEEYLKYYIMDLSRNYYYGGSDFKFKCLLPGPLYHGVPAAFILTTFILLGSTFVLMRNYDPESVLKLIEKEDINYIHATPTHLQRLLALPDEVKRIYDLSSMRTIVSCGAPCPVDIKKGINELFIRQGAKGPVYNEYYSSIEIAAPIALLRSRDYIENPKRIESVGKTNRCGEVKILDKDGKECPPNKEGRIYARTMGTTTLHYLGTEELVKENLCMIGGKEWYNELELGYLDDDGFLYITGREKELIIVGGVNVYPNEIEASILRHPKVLDVAVIKIPDKDLGELPGAIIQLKEGESAVKEEIIEHCRKDGLYGYKIPRIVEFIKELPKTPHGKTLKRELEEKYAKK